MGKGGGDYVIISAEALRRINSQEELMLGSESLVIWYNAGKSVGKIDGRRYAPLQSAMDLGAFASYLKDIYSRYGWGHIELGAIDPERGPMLFTAGDSPLVRGITSKDPRSWFVRGFVEGLVAELLGTDVAAMVTDCQAVNGRQCSYRVQ